MTQMQSPADTDVTLLCDNATKNVQICSFDYNKVHGHNLRLGIILAHLVTSLARLVSISWIIQITTTCSQRVSTGT
jgi:hypothetical protein